jgi:hypothetical protein
MVVLVEGGNIVSGEWIGVSFEEEERRCRESV